MGNHYHLLLETPQGNLSRVMRDMNGSYTMYFNTRYRRVGHLLQGRYKALLVDKENYLLEVSRYIHLNPVREEFVERPEDYQYSSMSFYFEDGVIRPWMDVTYLLFHFGSVLPEQRKRYKKFVYDKIHDKEYMLNNVYANHILGSEDFVEKIIKTYLRKKLVSQEVPDAKKLIYGKSLGDVAKVVVEYYKVDRNLLYKRKRGHNRPQKVFIYLSRRYTDTTLGQIRHYLKNSIGENSISKIFSRIQDEMCKDKSLKKEVDIITTILLG